jgi:hypothetical protein
MALSADGVRGPTWLRYTSPVPLVVAIGLAGGLAFFMHRQQEAIVSRAGVDRSIDDQGQLRPLADVMQATRALKLVTVMVTSRVRARVQDEQWRGNVSAVVEAPVRYVYGVDLSQLRDDSFRVGPALGIYEISIPPPERLAVEVDGSHPIDEIVDVSGTRLRSRAGEYYLGLARRAIYEEARNQVLPEQTMNDVRATTREQVESVVRLFASPRAVVHVRYQSP